MKATIVVVDLINDFVTGSLNRESAFKIIPNIQRFLTSSGRKNCQSFTRMVLHAFVEAAKEEICKAGLEYMKTIYGCKITEIDELTKKELVQD